MQGAPGQLLAVVGRRHELLRLHDVLVQLVRVVSDLQLSIDYGIID